MIKAVIFDMFETLITHYRCPLYFGAQMARDAGIDEEVFQSRWCATEHERSVGKMTLEEVIEMINSKLIDIGFSISESNCDDGVVYYSFVNTVRC